MRLVRILILALGLMALATSASFAAASFATSAGLNQIAVNAQTGLLGSIQLTALAPGTVAAGEILSLVVNGAPISSLSDLQVVVTTGTGANITANIPVPTSFAYNTAYPIATVLAGVAAPGPMTVTVVNNSTILIKFPAAVTFTIGDNILISGLRVNANALGTVGGNITANLSSVLGGETVTNPTVQVGTLVEPISITATAANFTTAAGTVTGAATLVASELFTNAFETKGVTPPTQLIFTISNIPAGLTMGAATVNIAPATTASVTAAVISSVQAAGTTTGIITVGVSLQDSSALEKVSVNVPFTVNFGTTSLPVGGIGTVQGTLGPAASATQLSNVNLSIAPIVVDTVTAGNALKFAQRLVPTTPANAVIITQLTTQLLAPFSTWIPGSFDTGFAVANTTGFGSALVATQGFINPQPGNVTVILYPADGTASKTITTSATVLGGTGGLDANGQILPHGEWTVLLSTIATQAGFTTGFTGQVWIITNFSNAHGVNYIADSNFKVSAQGYPLLIVPTGRTANAAATPEQLNN